jgi:hypothetical protein
MFWEGVMRLERSAETEPVRCIATPHVSSPGLTGRSSNPSAFSTNRHAAGYWIPRLKRGMTSRRAVRTGFPLPAFTGTSFTDTTDVHLIR